MKPEIVKKWTTALRSGEYKKTKGHLKDPRGKEAYCCLGVLTCLYNKEHPKAPYDFKFQDDIDNSCPDEVQIWAGMKTGVGVFYNKKGQQKDLTMVNDDDKAKRGFKYIADLIEKYQNQL
jgi:hypothetical protein